MKDEWKKYRGRWIGTAGGLFFGLVFLAAGFWKTLIFAFIVFLGYHMGKKADRNEPWISSVWKDRAEKWIDKWKRGGDRFFP